MALRVLHIDDELDILTTVKAALEKVADVDIATSLGDALEKLNSGDIIPYDVLLVDLLLSDASDIQVVTALRPYRIPMIVISALGDPDVLKRAAAAGADDFFIKPYLKRDELIERIHFVCERAKCPRPSKVCAKIRPETFESVKPFITYGSKAPFVAA